MHSQKHALLSLPADLEQGWQFRRAAAGPESCSSEPLSKYHCRHRKAPAELDTLMLVETAGLACVDMGQDRSYMTHVNCK